MYTKSVVVLAAFAVAQTLAQPYCVLTAVNKFEHPADQKTICCAESEKMKGYLKELCPSSTLSAAETAYETACKEAGYEVGKCSGGDKSSSESASATEKSEKSKSTGAPYPVIHTSIYYDTECGCHKTMTYSSSAVAGSTGFATGTAPVATGSPAPGKPGSPGAPAPAATGSPISPAAPGATGTKTGPATSKFTGAATRNVGSVAAGLLAVAGVALAL